MTLWLVLGDQWRGEDKDDVSAAEIQLIDNMDETQDARGVGGNPKRCPAPGNPSKTVMSCEAKHCLAGRPAAEPRRMRGRMRAGEMTGRVQESTEGVGGRRKRWDGAQL